MAPKAFVAPQVLSTSVFKEDIFKGKVLFCTGGGSGICRGMTEAVVCPNSLFSLIHPF
jgi:peroxisomal 2,4-dienoyl-CoA reductase